LLESTCFLFTSKVFLSAFLHLSFNYLFFLSLVVLLVLLVDIGKQSWCITTCIKKKKKTAHLASCQIPKFLRDLKFKMGSLKSWNHRYCVYLLAKCIIVMQSRKKAISKFQMIHLFRTWYGLVRDEQYIWAHRWDQIQNINRKWGSRQVWPVDRG
jgi:hypothetical protein